MRPPASILAVTVGVLVLLSSPVAFSQVPTLHCDGAYRRVNGDKTTQHLRFYRDGFVVSAVTPRAQTPGWLERDFPGLPSGRYSVRGNRIEITLNTNLPVALPDNLRKAIPRTLHYAGVIGPGYLELRRDGITESKRYDFVKIVDTFAQQPMPHASSAIDAKGLRHSWVTEGGKPSPLQADLTRMVPPPYPYEARKARQEGSGVFRLQLDLATGKVTKATVLKSTGIVLLDNSALSALRRWQFKPGRWREIEIPISFSMSPIQRQPAPKTR